MFTSIAESTEVCTVIMCAYVHVVYVHVYVCISVCMYMCVFVLYPNN